jgi:hypothetical protein
MMYRKMLPVSVTIDSSPPCYQVLRVHVSPCRLKYLPPEVQTGHRVIRHFSNPDNAQR